MSDQKRDTIAIQDRRVHAATRDVQIVRYDRSGKWYIEWADGKRKHVSIDQAVEAATNTDGMRTFRGVLGGSAFDRKVDARG